MMIEVTRKRFYDFINPRDIICNVEGEYPYYTMFKFRNGEVVGKKENGNYFLKENIVTTIS